tara:strand:+ start:489 stop:833 length:345 start_codon:yes stop_codon:yes gene_type:complete
MAHKLVKYRLNEDGTIPDFVLHGHPHSVQGFAYVPDDTVPAPQNGVMLCITVDNPTGMFEEIETYDGLLEYLSEVGADWKFKEHSQIDDSFVTKEYNPVVNAQWVWNRIQALNA